MSVYRLLRSASAANPVLNRLRQPGRIPLPRLRTPYLFPLLIALEVGAAVRLQYVAASDFPLNDGGMFLAMVEDLLAGGLALPATTSYNQLGIPFAYPPLGFYAAAWLSLLLGRPPVEILQWLPPLVSIATILPFFWLARLFLRSRFQVTVALLAFAFVPRSYNWEIMGGGLTRSFGFFFALLTIASAYCLYRTGRRRYALLAGLWGSLTILSHMEMGWFAALTSGLFFLLWGRNRRGITHSLLVAVAVPLLTAPWWWTVVGMHGLGPFQAAIGSGNHSPVSWLPLLILNFADEPLASVFVALGLLGLFTFAADGRYAIPVWVVVLFLLDPRKAATTATVPMSLAVAVALDQMILPRLRSAPQRRLPQFLMAVLLAHVVLSQFSIPLTRANPLRTLPPEERAAMAWIAQETTTDSRFVVISPVDSWPQDATAEWFPQLTGRVGVTTVQGTEWLPNQRFETAKESYKTSQACAGAGVACIDAWAAEFGETFSHIYVSKGEMSLSMSTSQDCCSALRFALQQSDAYRTVYDGPGALVVVKRAD